jgi:hypothetical protein
MSNLRDTGRELRRFFGSSDPFMTGGHQILVERKHKKKVPEWAKSDKEVRLIIQRSFPHWGTNTRQAERAGRWVRVIQLYFRMGNTHGQIAEEIGVNYNTVRMLIRAIKLAAKGRRTDGSGKFRPKIRRA